MADAFPTHNSVDYECSKYLCLGAFLFWPRQRPCPAAACAVQCAFLLCVCARLNTPSSCVSTGGLARPWQMQLSCARRQLQPRNGTWNVWVFLWVQQRGRSWSSHGLRPVNVLAFKQIVACQVREAQGCCHFLIQQQLGCFHLGNRVTRNVVLVGVTSQRACAITEMKISATPVILEPQLGKSWADLYLLVYAVFSCLSQDGGTYLGERYLVLKVPAEQTQAAAKPKSPSTNLWFVFIIWGYVWNTLPGITSQLQGLGTWEIELHSLSPHPPLKKPCALLGKKPKVIFLLHKSLLIYFPPLVAFQGLLQRKQELLRSD